MNIKKRTILILMLGAIALSNTLTLDNYLKDIINNDPAYSQIFLDNQNIKGALQSMRAMYDPRLSASYEYRKKDQQIYNFVGSPIAINDNKSFMTTLGLSKKVKATGTDISLSYLRMDTSSMLGPTSNTQINPSVTLKIAQPLWQDFMGIYSRMDSNKLEMQKELVALSVLEAKENYFLQATNLYYDWLSLSLAITPLSVSYQNAKLMYAQVKDQFNNDAALKTDLLQAENAVLLYKNALQQTMYSWNQVASSIYQKMGTNFTPETNWENLSETPIICDTFCQENNIDSLPNIRLIATTQKLLEQYQLDLEKAVRSSMPNLSVYGEIANYKNTSAATDSFTDLNKAEYAAGFAFSTPLGTNSLDGQKKSINADIEKTKQALTKTKNDLNTLYINQLLNLENIKTTEVNMLKIASNSRKILDMETKRFSQGKTMLFNITDYRQRYTQSKIDHLNKLVELSKQQVSLAALNDTLLDKINKLLGGE